MKGLSTANHERQPATITIGNANAAKAQPDHSGPTSERSTICIGQPHRYMP